MLRRLSVLLILITILFGCAKKSTDVNENSVLKLAGTVPLVGDPQDLSAYQNTLYVAEDQCGISIIDLTDYSKRWMTEIPSFDNSTVLLKYINKVNYVGPENKVFINETSGTDLIQIGNTTDPDNISLLIPITGGSSDTNDMLFQPIANPIDDNTIEGMYCSGTDVAYGKYNTTINIWEGVTKHFYTRAAAEGFFLTPQYVYVAVGQRGLAIYDRNDDSITNPTPTVGEIDLPGETQKVKVSGNYAYLACKQEGLYIVDVANPASPVRKGSYNTTGYATSLDVMGNLVAVSSGVGGVYLFDVANPSEPVLLEHLTSCGYTNMVKFHNGKLLVAARDQGVLVYNIEQ
jgi:hypothetical protein